MHATISNNILGGRRCLYNIDWLLTCIVFYLILLACIVSYTCIHSYSEGMLHQPDYITMFSMRDNMIPLLAKECSSNASVCGRV